VHDIWYSRALGGLTKVSEEERRTRPPAHHKLVHVHPRSGRKALYLASHIAGIVGMDEKDGHALVDELTAHATQPRFIYAHKWREGDLVMWDNLATMHRATAFDDFRHRRDMRRATTLERAA
jgi:alpha-ketoglutarate-dependent 2,4-dichlorophenoxyacetate dioxygenase